MDAPACAAATNVAGAPLQILIATDSDFVIQLTPPAKALAEKATNAPPLRTRTVQFHVSRAVVQNHSSFFEPILRARPDLRLVTFENQSGGFGYALEIWLRAIHNGVSTLPLNLKATHTERAWVAIGVGEQFGFAPQHIDKIKQWFIDCYHYALNSGPGLTPMTACCLAFPCSVFDHAEGFMKLTKYLAYHTNGNIFTHNPSAFQSLNQDARILDGPLITARAHLQSILDKELYFPLDKLHRASCSCRKETAFDYEDALIALDCWPVDKAVQRYPIADIIEELEKFEFTSHSVDCNSSACHHDFKNSVNIAIRKVKHAFDGLCLDCMERSQTDNLPHHDFIEKNSPFKGCWDMGCRFGHGRASWYFSWMGPSSVRRDILSKYRHEKRALGITSRGKRGKRTKHPARDTTTREDLATTGLSDVAVHSQLRACSKTDNDGSDKENSFQDNDERDLEEEDEFFDAEDTDLVSPRATNDEELNHDKIN